MTDMQSLHKKTRELLIEKTTRDSKRLTAEDIANGKTSARKISEDTDIDYEFIRSFKLERRGHPSVDKVQKLYEYLTGKPLKV
jgi:hypothetical protein